jgi:hypothetical protein
MLLVLKFLFPMIITYIDKKENQIFLIYKEIQSGAVAKSYRRKGFLIYEEMRKYFPLYEEAVSHIICLCNCFILNFLIYDENLFFFFISVTDRFIISCRSSFYSPCWCACCMAPPVRHGAKLRPPSPHLGWAWARESAE